MAQTLAVPKYPPLSIGEATHTLHMQETISITDTLMGKLKSKVYVNESHNSSQKIQQFIFDHK